MYVEFFQEMCEIITPSLVLGDSKFSHVMATWSNVKNLNEIGKNSDKQMKLNVQAA